MCSLEFEYICRSKVFLIYFYRYLGILHTLQIPKMGVGYLAFILFELSPLLKMCISNNDKSIRNCLRSLSVLSNFFLLILEIRVKQYTNSPMDERMIERDTKYAV